MNEVQLRERLKTFSDAIGLNAANFTLRDKPAWFAALVQDYKSRGETIPSSLESLTRRYGRMDEELDRAIKAIKKRKEAEVGASKKDKS